MTWMTEGWSAKREENRFGSILHTSKQFLIHNFRAAVVNCPCDIQIQITNNVLTSDIGSVTVTMEAK